MRRLLYLFLGLCEHRDCRKQLIGRKLWLVCNTCGWTGPANLERTYREIQATRTGGGQ